MTTPRTARSSTPMRYLPVAPVPESVLAHGWPPVWWVGCHGGAGTSTLVRLTGVGVDAGTAWPQVPPTWPMASVLLVCRASAAGTWAAVGAVDQWRRKLAGPCIRVLGVVAVAASPRRTPRVAAERLELLAGWVPMLRRVGWVETLLAAEDPQDVGVPPDVAGLGAAVAQELTSEAGTT